MSPLLRRAMFEAPWWALPINPHFLPRRALHAAMRAAAPALAGPVLDVGCGLQPYRALFAPGTQVIGLEVAGADVSKCANVRYDGARIPFATGSFRGVLCNQVLEHVFAPESLLLELHRVLAPQGRLVLSVPFIWPEHEQPRDSQRYTSFGLRAMLERTGFEVLEQRKLVTGAAVPLALLADGLNGALRRLPLPLRLGGRLLLVAPLSALGWLLGGMQGRDAELYLDNFVIAARR